MRIKQIIAVVVLFFGFVGISWAGMIIDEYWGADDHNWEDVIGNPDYFNIESANVSRIGNQLHVDIFTNFAGRGDDGLFTGLTGGKGIGYGDLFLSVEWNPIGDSSDQYISDNHSNGTNWTYGFALDNRWWDGTGIGAGTLYSLTGTNAQDALLSQDFLTGGTYRGGQEVAVNTTSTTTVVGNSGTWSIDETNKKISFWIDATGTALASSDGVALHWGMTCANDTIEGYASVPEPTTLALLGAGLLAIPFARRRKRKAALLN